MSFLQVKKDLVVQLCANICKFFCNLIQNSNYNTSENNIKVTYPNTDEECGQYDFP